MAIRIETFSRKRPLRRRQYHARIVDTANGKVLWRTSEGYNNAAERGHAIDRIVGLTSARIVDLD